MDINKFLEQVKQFGFGEDVSYPDFSCKTIKAEEIVNIICETLLNANVFPINTTKIIDGMGWTIKKRPLLGYELIYYNEIGMCNYAVCWRKWYLTRKGAALEYVKRAASNILFLV